MADREVASPAVQLGLRRGRNPESGRSPSPRPPPAPSRSERDSSRSRRTTRRRRPAEPPAPKEHKESKEARDAKEAKDVKEAKEAKEKDAAAAEEPAPLPISIARLVPKLKKSAKLFEEGKKRIPNSTSSLIRVASYDPCPPFIAKGKGPRIWDEDGNEYLDFNLAYGCLINGHAHPQMVKAIQKQAELGFHFASPTELEIEVATLFQKLVPNAERVAFCSNGSDATMNAIRIARAATGKDGILKFEGHYHGQHDYALISAEAPPIVAGLDEYPRPMPNSAGIPPGVTDYVTVAPYQFDPCARADGEAVPGQDRGRHPRTRHGQRGHHSPAPDYLKQLRGDHHGQRHAPHL